MPRLVPKIVTSIDGRIVPARAARIPVIDNSFLYAEGLFETFLAVGDRLIFANRHLRRLKNGARMIGLRLPVADAKLRRWMKTAAGRHPDRYKKVRLTITSGDSPRWTGKPGKPRVVISVSRHDLPEEPFKLQVSEFLVDQDSPFRQIKTVSYAIQAAAFRKALASGYDDAILLNENHRVAEVTSANIFWVKRGIIYTPPLSAGCLDGVTRRAVIAVARRLKLKIAQRHDTLGSMLSADEIFISSSLKLVVGVGVIGHGARRTLISGGPVTEMLHEYFRRMVDEGDSLTL
ncbi:MAG: aminotransferase class IV [candidate division Zixibacteria bacterium]|nr:aminotransferase class IV [candidate division Zixibacteria bacterium]